jgi:hypothetical protein
VKTAYVIHRADLEAPSLIIDLGSPVRKTTGVSFVLVHLGDHHVEQDDVGERLNLG